MDLNFALSSMRRRRGNLPDLPLKNMFVEKAETEPKGITLQSRPGLEDHGVNSGAGPVSGVFQKDGVLGGSLFTVSNGALYRDGVSVGAVTGTGHCSIAGNEIGLCVNLGGPVYFYDGTNLTTANFPDGVDVAKVMEIAGRFIAIRKGTQKFYWTEVLTAALTAGILTFPALNFASAENEPDQLVDMAVIDDILVLGGKETVEWWSQSGVSTLPFTPIAGRVYDKGVRATGCMVNFDNGVVYVSGDGLVYRSGNVPERISDSGIEERLAGSTSAALFTFFFEGHEFCVLRLDDASMVYDAQSQDWPEFASYGEDNWICRCACPGPIFGSAVDGKTLVFGDTHADLGGELERLFGAGVALDGGTLPIDRLSLRCNPGQTPYLTGQYAEPVIEMRSSRDAGQSWGNWKAARLGNSGQFRKHVEWRALGVFDAPGVLVQFRVTDPVPLRVSAVKINEEHGGRAR